MSGEIISRLFRIGKFFGRILTPDKFFFSVLRERRFFKIEYIHVLINAYCRVGVKANKLG